MATIKISQLPSSASPLAGTEVVPLVQSGVTRKAAVDLLGGSSSVINVKDYGATGDGSTNDTAAIQAAINAATGKVVYFPAGFYSHTTLTISSPMKIVGDGPDLTYLKYRSTTGNSIVIDCSSAIITGLMISDLSIWSASAKSSGYAISQLAATGALYFSEISNVKIENNNFSGIKLVSTYFVTLRDINITQLGYGGVGFLFQGSASTSSGNCMLSRLRVASGLGNAVGMIIDSYAQGLYISQCTFESDGLANGIVIDNTLAAPEAQQPRNIFMDQVICDYSSNTGLEVRSGWTIQATNSWFTSSIGGAGVDLIKCFDVRFDNCSVVNNHTNGFKISDACNTITINNCGIMSNSIAGNNTYSGVRVNYNATDFVISNCQFARNGDVGRHKYSIEILGGTSQRFTVTGNNLYGWATAPIYDGTATKVKNYAGNVGWPASDIVTPTLPASFNAATNSNPFSVEVLVWGGTVSNIDVDGTTTTLASGTFVLKPNQPITIGYTVAPTWVWRRLD